MKEKIWNYFKHREEKVEKRIWGYFKLGDRKSTIKKEIVGGLTTFFAMAYILAVQPAMMSSAPVNLPYGGIFLSTIISSFFATFVMGLLANVPIGLAPGMGINAFFAFTVCGILGIDVNQALSVVLISGWLYFLVAITPFRQYISKAFPKNLKLAIGVGIGFFIGFVGLQETGIIQSDAFAVDKNLVLSPTSVRMGNLKNPLILLSIFVFLTMLILYFLKIKGAIIISIIIGIAAMSIMHFSGVDALSGEANPFKLNDFASQFNEFGDIAGTSYKNILATLKNPVCYIAIFVFLYSDFFDTTGTLFVLDESAKFSKDDKEQKWLKKANVADALGTIFGASIGSTTVTSYVESQAGVGAGARTGLASIFTGAMFLFAILLFPIMGPVMPIKNIVNQANFTKDTLSPITGPILMIIGILMMMQLKEFDWKKTIDIPVLFIIALFMPLTYSISSGIAAGVIVFVVLNFALGIKQFILRKYFNKDLKNSNYDEILYSDLDKLEKTKADKEIDYFKWINLTIIILFSISVIYFSTTVLYSGY